MSIGKNALRGSGDVIALGLVLMEEVGLQVIDQSRPTKVLLFGCHGGGLDIEIEAIDYSIAERTRLV